ncbi:hypothetical protein [Schumannella luteola]
MNLSRVLALALAAFTLSGCSTAQLSDHEIAGLYSAVVAGEPSVVELRADGTAAWANFPDPDGIVDPGDLDDADVLDLVTGEGTWVTGFDATTTLSSRRGVRLLVGGEVFSALSVAPTLFGVQLVIGLCDPDIPACTIEYAALVGR